MGSRDRKDCKMGGDNAWGKCTIKTNVNGIATINPFRYRGYYCDKETGLYYLNARYYDPEIGRFISPDAIDTVVTLSFNVQNGLNSYAYCLNDPVNYCDIQGFFPSKGHQSGHGFDEFRGLSVGQLDELYKLLRKSRNKEDRATAQKIQTELKLRQMRNKTKREGYGRSKMVIISRTLPRIFVYPSYSDILPGILSSPFGLELPSST